jgi:hypothetical protein
MSNHKKTVQTSFNAAAVKYGPSRYRVPISLVITVLLVLLPAFTVLRNRLFIQVTGHSVSDSLHPDSRKVIFYKEFQP